MDLHPDLIDLLTVFANCGVEYLIVGGWAVGVHSEPRYTKDLDVLIGTAPDNLERVVSALQDYGAPPALIEDIRTMQLEEFVFFGVPPARVDLLRQIPGVDFGQAWPRRKTIQWKGIDVQVIAFTDLVAAKSAAGRAKDRDDLRILQRFKP